MKSKLKKIKSQSALGFYFVAFLQEIRSRWVLGFFIFAVKLIYCYFLTCKLFGLSLMPRVYFSSSIFKVKIKNKGTVISSSRIPIIFESFVFNNATTSIVLNKNAVLEFKDTFHIGDGCRILVNTDAKIIIHGKSSKNISGITCQSIILCSKIIEIKAGTIISWGCYITDSSNHKINGQVTTLPVVIEENVWISEGVTILPGSHIGTGSIVAAKSVVRKTFENNSLIAGIPARMVHANAEWER